MCSRAKRKWTFKRFCDIAHLRDTFEGSHKFTLESDYSLQPIRITNCVTSNMIFRLTKKMTTANGHRYWLLELEGNVENSTGTIWNL